MLRPLIVFSTLRAKFAGLARTRFVVVVSVCAAASLGTVSPPLASATVTSAGAPSKAQYIAKADAICTAEGKLLAPYAEKYSQLTSARRANDAQAAIILTESDAIRSAALAKLRALPVPAGARTRLTGIWNTFDKLITETDEVAMALGGSDTPTMATLDANAELTGGQYELEAQAYGFKVCGASHS